MLKFDDFFSPANITRELCKARLSLADRRHEALFYHQIDRSRDSAEKVKIPETWREIPTDIFPSRRLWSRYRAKDRRGQSDPNLSMLVRAVHKLLEETPDAPWAVRLKRVVNEVAQRALAGRVSLSPPLIIKEVKDKEKQTYRPLASFFLSDKIIESLTARYLREALNPAPLRSCLAFRPRMDGRHDGLDTILNLRTEQDRSGLFVAECDVMGFFDCVSHRVARESLNELIADAEAEIDPRAIQIFMAYLECYSFWRNVKQIAEADMQKRNPSATFPWREKQLRELHGNSSGLPRIGIPQGGALSGLIANAVLHRADKALRHYCQERNVTYLRYCDDMIVLAPTRTACKEAFAEYCATVRELKLPIHEPQIFGRYQGEQRKAFWSNAKSRDVYHWGDPRSNSSFPWIQFLGYQIRFDGKVRVRRSSIQKELVKLALQTDRILRMLTPPNVKNLRKSKTSIKHRVRMKLISMAVGRCDLRERDEPLPKCWANGFRWLAGKNIIPGNLKALDRQRERQINRVARRLNGLSLELPPSKSEDDDVLDHYGCPFSYWGQFKREEHT